MNIERKVNFVLYMVTVFCVVFVRQHTFALKPAPDWAEAHQPVILSGDDQHRLLGFRKHTMTRGKQKVDAQKRNAERQQKPKGSQLEARAAAFKSGCPICKVRCERRSHVHCDATYSVNSRIRTPLVRVGSSTNCTQTAVLNVYEH